MVNLIDFNELEVIKKEPEIMDILLIDRSSKKNIKWCTDNYKRYGISSTDYINKDLFLKKSNLIKPRIIKSQAEQKKRSKDMAEVFTPSWVCNKQNNLIDNAWFGYNNAFNEETDKGWISNEKVSFKDDKLWQDYVSLERMEITCGEAPYLVSRYDTTTGLYIETKNRIGLLDRKLRVISENVDNEDEWLKYTKIAYQSVYGYEYQGDNLLIARENLLMTFIDYYQDKFKKEPLLSILLDIATIISWNIWQMDGLKYVIPNSCHNEQYIQTSLFFDEKPDFCLGCRSNNIYKHNGIYCKIKDWKTNKTINFKDLMR